MQLDQGLQPAGDRAGTQTLLCGMCNHTPKEHTWLTVHRVGALAAQGAGWELSRSLSPRQGGWWRMTSAPQQSQLLSPGLCSPAGVWGMWPQLLHSLSAGAEVTRQLFLKALGRHRAASLRTSCRLTSAPPSCSCGLCWAWGNQNNLEVSPHSRLRTPSLWPHQGSGQ